MLANQSTPATLLKRALLYTVYRLEAAADLGLDFTAAERQLFREEAARLLPFALALPVGERDLEDFALGAELRRQVRATYGDKVLDEGYRAAKAAAKSELRQSRGLGHEHAFGADAAEITHAPMEQEPDLVLEVVRRLPELPEFASRAKLADDLTARAEQQKAALLERSRSAGERDARKTRQAAAVDAAVKALVQTKAVLELRFPKNRAVVAPFFYDVTPPAKKKLDKRLVAIYANLAAHEVEVDEEAKAKLEAETDAAVLERWLARSVAAKAVAELFG
jgi:hypothetical protein